LNKPNFNQIKSVAVVRTDRIGDMVLTLPLCRAIKQLNNNIRITVIAKSYTAELLENNVFVDEALYIDNFKNGINSIFKEYRFDAVFFPRPVFKEALSALKNGIPIRIGSAFRWYSFLFNQKVHDHRKTGNLHEAEYNVRLLSSISNSDFEVKLVKPNCKKEDSEKVDEILLGNGIKPGDDYIILHPGSKGSAKDWSSINFGKLSKAISQIYKTKIIITGVDSEVYQCTDVAKLNREALNLCGKLTLGQLIALISNASLLISNSTGVIHLAAASDIPVVGIYPNTSHIGARRWGPFSDKKVIVSPDKNSKDIDDVNSISVEEVFSAVEKLLGKQFKK
jgi:ADP-heptose:LPS heptosyltransferase